MTNTPVVPTYSYEDYGSDDFRSANPLPVAPVNKATVPAAMPTDYSLLPEDQQAQLKDVYHQFSGSFLDEGPMAAAQYLQQNPVAKEYLAQVSKDPERVFGANNPTTGTIRGLGISAGVADVIRRAGTTPQAVVDAAKANPGFLEQLKAFVTPKPAQEGSPEYYARQMYWNALLGGGGIQGASKAYAETFKSQLERQQEQIRTVALKELELSNKNNAAQLSTQSFTNTLQAQLSSIRGITPAAAQQISAAAGQVMAASLTERGGPMAEASAKQLVQQIFQQQQNGALPEGVAESVARQLDSAVKLSPEEEKVLSTYREAGMSDRVLSKLRYGIMDDEVRTAMTAAQKRAAQIEAERKGQIAKSETAARLEAERDPAVFADRMLQHWTKGQIDLGFEELKAASPAMRAAALERIRASGQMDAYARYIEKAAEAGLVSGMSPISITPGQLPGQRVGMPPLTQEAARATMAAGGGVPSAQPAAAAAPTAQAPVAAPAQARTPVAQAAPPRTQETPPAAGRPVPPRTSQEPGPTKEWNPGTVRDIAAVKQNSTINSQYYAEKIVPAAAAASSASRAIQEQLNTVENYPKVFGKIIQNKALQTLVDFAPEAKQEDREKFFRNLGYSREEMNVVNRLSKTIADEEALLKQGISAKLIDSIPEAAAQKARLAQVRDTPETFLRTVLFREKQVETDKLRKEFFDDYLRRHDSNFGRFSQADFDSQFANDPRVKQIWGSFDKDFATRMANVNAKLGRSPQPVAPSATPGLSEETRRKYGL